MIVEIFALRRDRHAARRVGGRVRRTASSPSCSGRGGSLGSARYAVALALPLLSPLWAASAPPAAAATFAAIAGGHADPASRRSTGTRRSLWLWAAATARAAACSTRLRGRVSQWIARRWPRAQSDDSQRPRQPTTSVPRCSGFSSHAWFCRVGSWTRRRRLRSTVVAHELEHIAARDQAAIVAAQLIAILLPWNLPLWWFAKRLRAAIEIDCDARVLRQGVDPAHYADVCWPSASTDRPSPYIAATLIEPVTQLERRIRIMLTSQRPRSVHDAP